MTTTWEIVDALRELLLERVPELEAVYCDAVPKQFKRPSLLIEPVSTTTEDASASLVRVSEYLTLVVYGGVDSYGNSDSAQLLALRRRVQELLRGGYLPVNGRALAVQTSTGGFAWDRAWLDLQLEFHDNRSDLPDLTPMIESVHTSVFNNSKE